MAVAKRAPRGRGKNEAQALKRENILLKKRIKEIEAERDSFRHMVHSWAKEQITEEEIQEWTRGIQEKRFGGSLLTLIKKLEKEGP